MATVSRTTLIRAIEGLPDLSLFNAEELQDWDNSIQSAEVARVENDASGNVWIEVGRKANSAGGMVEPIHNLITEQAAINLKNALIAYFEEKEDG